ncbi:hypothetical protein RIR_jg16459.t1 [Rhizophagus irregularis DAOM 181602=DAOM 197198]|nr:hypothetical protein RIR_jg16459.t1 [Rhizophagus irregularis DAOM 181602=DAOM 197198]
MENAITFDYKINDVCYLNWNTLNRLLSWNVVFYYPDELDIPMHTTTEINNNPEINDTPDITLEMKVTKQFCSEKQTVFSTPSSGAYRH